MEDLPKETDHRKLKVGDTFFIEGEEYTIEKVESASDMAIKYGLRINRSVPVYFLNKNAINNAHGAYDTENDMVLIYKNMTDLNTLEHEFIHVIEYHQEPTPGLIDLYNKVKETITESSFDQGLFRFNFMKSIHEFIADGKTNFAFIEALKKEGLYEDFERETAYLFE
jgi:hypothetical protein